MNLHSKKALSLLMSALMLALSFSSCSDNTADETKAETAPDAAQTEPETTAESEEETEARIQPDLPDVKYDGYTYKMLVWLGAERDHERDYYADELTGDPVNDAVFNRNSTIESKYDIKIEVTESPIVGYVNEVSSVMNLNTDEYQLIYSRGNEFSSFIGKKHFRNVLDIDYLDFEKPWWDSNFTDSLSINGKAFGAISDLTTRDKSNTCVAFFNKNIQAAHDLPDLYEIADAGKWTMDKMIELSEGIYEDKNGNGRIDNGDVFPIGTNAVGVPMLFHGGGARFFEKDEEGYPRLALMNDRTITLCQRILTLFADERMVNNENSSGIQCVDAFGEEKELFLLYAVGGVEKLRDSDVDFGIVPMPKYEETQENYENTVSIHGTSIMCFPVTIADIDRAAIIAEALSAESYYTLRGEYYDTLIKHKAMRDVESGRMLDIIFQNRVYDMGEFYGLGSYSSELQSMSINHTTDVVSSFKSKEKLSEKAVERFVKSFDENEA